MDYIIKTSRRAKIEIFQTVDYIIDNWSESIAFEFLDKFEELKILLSNNPEMFPIYKEESNIRIAVLTKHNKIYFTMDEQNGVVTIITVFNVLQNPDKLKL